MTAAPRQSARRRLLLVAAVFAAPLVAAYVLYYSGWRPSASRVYGELVEPARPLADVELAGLDGTPARLAALRPHWLLVYVGSSECGTPCARALYVMRQTIAAQGKRAPRLRSVMILTDLSARDGLLYQLKDYPDTVVLTGTPSSLAALAHEFELPQGRRWLYVVDPLGNLMLSYPDGADPSGIRKDLENLLRLSRIG